MDIGSLTGSLVIEDQMSSVLNLATTSVQQFAKQFDGMTKLVVIGAGLVIGVLTGITGAIVGLANTGSDVNDVSQTFQNFVGSAQEAANVLGRMRQGTLETVTDLDLMRNASKLLAADVNLTADQFGTMSEAAFVLQNQGLGPTKDMLDLVSQALLTGRTRTLEMKIGKLDLTKAVKDYAKQEGLSVKQLSDAQELEAKRIALLDALSKKVREAGVQQRDFGEQMEFALTKIRNWGIELSRQIAISPNVTRAVETIGTALNEAFGGTAQTLMQRIVEWVNNFADRVTYWAPIIVRWIRDIVDRVSAFITKVQQYWNTVPDWFKNIAAQAAVTAAGVVISAKALDMATSSTERGSTLAAEYATAVSGTRDAVLSAAGAQQLWGARMTEAFKSTVTWTKSAAKELLITFAMIRTFGIPVALTTGLQVLGSAITGLVTSFGLIPVAVGGMIGGLRVLTGSWEFLGISVKVVWQGFKDLATIVSEVVVVAFNTVVGTVKDVDDAFINLGKTIGIDLPAIFEGTRDLIIDALIAIANTPQFRIITNQLALIQNLAEKIRGRPPLSVEGLPSKLPGTVVPIGGLPRKITPPSGKDPNEEFNEKVLQLSKSLKLADQDIKVFETAFKSLNRTQLDNVKTQEMLIPLIEQAAAVRRGNLNPAIRQEYERILESQRALVEKDKTMLDARNVTLRQIEALREMGHSETTIATLLKTSTTALREYTTELERHRAAEQGLASFLAATLADRERQRQREQARELAGNKAVSQAKEDLDEFIRKTTLSTTDYQIDQIERETLARMLAFDPSGQPAQRVEEYYSLVEELSRRRRQAVMIDEDALRDNSRVNLQQIADRARETYLYMERFPLDFSKRTREAFKQIAEEAQRRADGTKSAWERAFKALDNVSTILDAIPGKFAEIGSMAARTGQEILEAFRDRDLIGGIVAAVTGVIGIFTKLFDGVSKEVKKAREEIDKFGDELASSLTEQQRIEAGGERWKETVIAVRDAYLLLGRTVSEAEDVVRRMWDTGNPGRARAAQQEIAINMALAQNITAVRGLVQEYIGAGVKIPAILQQKIDLLVKAGKLTAQNAAEVLNLTKTSVPSFAEITAAAERYGLQIDALGTGVQKLRITEILEQAVADFKAFEAAGADMTVVLHGMSDEVQAVVTDALKFGIELPKSAQPMIEKMAEMGLLTDEFGNKLVDTSRLTWAETLTEKVEKLVDAMLKLVDVIDRGLGGALDNISNKTISPRVSPRFESADVEPPIYAAGGTVVPFRPRGSDTVPAMLTPGEVVLSRGEAAAYREGTGGTVVINIEGREMARIVVPHMRNEVKRWGLARR